MVQAILEGRKTQTRRVVSPQPTYSENCGFGWKGYVYGIGSDYAETVKNFTDSNCPFGKVGERLWVRETFGTKIRNVGGTPHESFTYKADNPNEIYCYDCNGNGVPVKWKPSIHMPRVASRILLEITKIGIERLNDISEADCVKEGIGSALLRDCKRPKFMQLWESINGAGSWNENPWVWVVEFKVVGGK